MGCSSGSVHSRQRRPTRCVQSQKSLGTTNRLHEGAASHAAVMQDRTKTFTWSRIVYALHVPPIHGEVLDYGFTKDKQEPYIGCKQASGYGKQNESMADM